MESQPLLRTGRAIFWSQAAALLALRAAGGEKGSAGTRCAPRWTLRPRFRVTVAASQVLALRGQLAEEEAALDALRATLDPASQV